MKKHFMRFWIMGVVSLVLAALPLQAAPYITGEISFTGGMTLNGTLDSATAISSYFGPLGPGGGPLVNYGSTGSYAGLTGTPTTFTPFSFDSQPVTPLQLWTFSVGPVVYSFEIDSVTIFSQTSRFLNIEGTGTAYITGFEPTAATWSITGTGFPGSQVFTFGNVTAVPEPSTSLMLLGLGAFFVRAFRRNSKA